MIRYINLFIALFAFSATIYGQTAPTNFVIISTTPVDTSYSINGWGQDYPSGTTFNLNFGKENNNTPGTDDIMVSFEVNNESYTPITLPNGECYSRVVVNRVANGAVSDLNFQTIFFERGSANGPNRFFLSSYTDVQSAVNRRIINRGSDNVFGNTGSARTKNNVERIDLMVDGGIFTPDNNGAGFLFNERGGNDDFKVAAITSLSSSGSVATLGPLVSIQESQGHWGGTGREMVSTVFMKGSGDPAMRPSQDLSSQEVYGVFVTFADLGIDAHVQIYGVSVFPADVDETMDLIGLTDVPLDTDNASGSEGGLDLMGGGGFFASESLDFITDLQSKLTTSNMTPEADDVISIFLTISNNGPGDDNNVTATTSIPSGYSFLNIVNSHAGTANEDNGTITWTLNQLDTDVSEVLEIEVQAQDNSGDRLFTSNVEGDLTDVSPGNNEDGLMVDLSTDDMPLPVSLLHLSATNMDHHVLIRWATATEVNNDHFLLEKSTAGQAFQVVERIEGHGNSNTVKEYSYMDHHRTEGVAYYRLRQVDYDGGYELFGPVAISHNPATHQVNVYPNPAKESITISGLTPGAQVTLLNRTGQVHKRFTTQNASTTIHVKELPAGLYVLKILTGNKVDNRKIVLE